MDLDQRVTIDIRIGLDATRAMRFLPTMTGAEMMRIIVQSMGLPSRDDYLLYVPPTEHSSGKWLPKGETLQGYIEHKDFRLEQGLELRRTPHPLVVHMAQENSELQLEEVIANTLMTKRIVADLSCTGMELMRELRILFAQQTKLTKSKDEYTLRVLRGDDKTEWLTMCHSLWEQGVVPGDVIILYPVCRIVGCKLKEVLSAAMFSGWLTPMKSASSTAAAPGPTMRKSKSSVTIRSKKSLFAVLRSSLLFFFKSDNKTEKAESVIILDHYRASKVEYEKGYALRLDQREIGFMPMPAAYCFCAAEGEVDLWIKTILLSERPPNGVFGVSLSRVANRRKNANQYAPDFLALLVDELEKRIDNDPARAGCLGSADAKPPLELTKNLNSEKLPSLMSHADIACAATLRAYLMSLPQAVVPADVLSALSASFIAKDVPMASAAIAACTDTISMYSLKLILKLLARAPEKSMSEVAALFSVAVFGQQLTPLLEWMLHHVRELCAVDSVIANAVSAATFAMVSPRKSEPATAAVMASSPPPSSVLSPLLSDRNGSGSAGNSVQTTALYNYEARSAKELSIEAGQTVSVSHALASGWSVVRIGDGPSGLVPTTYLAPFDLSKRRDVSPPGFSPRNPSIEEMAPEDKILLRFNEFERQAWELLETERREKQRLADLITSLENKRRATTERPM